MEGDYCTIGKRVRDTSILDVVQAELLIIIVHHSPYGSIHVGHDLPLLLHETVLLFKGGESRFGRLQGRDGFGEKVVGKIKPYG